ncbi:hypothetical protein E0Z10_g7719 [Xylaria hypoxylon]|uniref:YTH domain-containing protein n=1 Tax=Xylaria hypoxylon TaxID=37992 RepID=A0A4Z0YPY1_9PEZI|nr:hypothetical protein E0Z10_g7719 [Xylaria hypoxylon]
MGDILQSADTGSDSANPEVPKNPLQGMKPDDGSSTSSQSTGISDTTAFQGQYRQSYAPSSNPFSSQLDIPLAQGSSLQGPYDMNAMANALPPSGYRQGYGGGQQHQRYTPAGPNMIPQMVHFPGQPHMMQLANQQYYLPQHQQIQQYFSAQASPSSQHQQHQLGSMRGGMNVGYYANPELTGSRPSIVRGPPRKPSQSGHAIWIGNLPPQTELMSLVYHICRETTGLESLFLISKSNCAFANFRDETSCIAAQQKLHDSKFQSVRLVSRLRKSTVEGTSGQTAPTGPAAISPAVQSVSSDLTSSSPLSKSTDSLPIQEAGARTKGTPVANGIQQKDKFFILKSLTVEDLDLSIQNGVWATQSHNEEGLNDAFGAADNVYLIFSANKSGEYFGYARMISPINHDPAAAIQFAPKAQATSTPDLPRAIPTQATDTCPRGRIIDDSARGTIFWEVERDEVDGVSDTVSEDSESARSMHNGEGGSKAWGKPFKLEWLSTTRLPFYKTRGLRNPWNSNREVKIARDGTEIEPAVGRKLIGLFTRVQSPIPVSTTGMTGIPIGYHPQGTPHFH